MPTRSKKAHQPISVLLLDSAFRAVRRRTISISLHVLRDVGLVRMRCNKSLIHPKRYAALHVR